MSEAEGQAPNAPAAPADIDVEKELPAGDTFPREVVEKLRSEAASKRVALKQYEALGDLESLKKGAAIVSALATDEGLKQIFQEAGDLMVDAGHLTREQLAGLTAKAEAKVEAAEDKKGSALTEAQVAKIVADLIDKEVRQPAAEKDKQAAFDAQLAAVNSVLKELEVSDDERDYVLAAGNRFLGEDQSPAAFAEAVKKGHAKYLADLEKAAGVKLAGKRAKGESVPKALSGGSSAPTGEKEPEPMSVKDAIRRRRARGL